MAYTTRSRMHSSGSDVAPFLSRRKRLPFRLAPVRSGVLLTVAALGVASCGVLSAAAGLDLVPKPKAYAPCEGTFSVAGKPIFIPAGNRQCAIAAEELAIRIRELGGGAPGPTTTLRGTNQPPGIYVLPVCASGAADLIRQLHLTVSPTNPGLQGYVIHARPERVVVIGSDDVGALYGAMTLRQMLVRDAAGASVVACADVRDWPDFRCRGTLSYLRALGGIARGERDPLAAYRTCIDWMLRFKLNILTDYAFGGFDERRYTPQQRAFIAEVNAYARERGLETMMWTSTSLYDEGTRPAGMTRESWPCLYDERPWTQSYYCWSRDEEAQARIKGLADFLAECHFSQVAIHCADGGGWKDPEMWSRRGDRCRARWADDERWKASIHQFDLWIRILRQAVPDLDVSLVLYPYSSAYLDPKPDPADEIVRKHNTEDYLQRVVAGLDTNIYILAWMDTNRSRGERYRKLIHRPMMYTDHYPVPAGLFTTSARHYAAAWFGERRDIIQNTSNDSYGRWMSTLCAGEYGWNAHAAGSEPTMTLYYDILTDHSGPPEVINAWLPAACRLFWGAEMGPGMATFYGANMWPRYIERPGALLSEVNQWRRNPYAGTDPQGTAVAQADTRPGIIVDTPELMEAQVKATERAWGGLRDALPHLAGVDPYRQKLFLHYYRRVPYWTMSARVEWHLRIANRLARDGAVQAAADRCRQAIQQLADDYKTTTAVMAEYASRPDITPLAIEDAHAALSNRLLARLDSLSFVMQPRRVGRHIRVGIHKGDIAVGIQRYLAGFTNVQSEIIGSLALTELDRFDAVIVGPSPDIVHDDFFLNLRTFVSQGGGGVILEHSLCGAQRFALATPFPEVVTNSPERVDIFSREIRVVANPVLTPRRKDDTRLMYVDAFLPVAGPEGFPIAADPQGRTMAVGGRMGLGKVVFNGSISLACVRDGYAVEPGVPLTGFNAALVCAALEWFTGVDLEPKDSGE